MSMSATTRSSLQRNIELERLRIENEHLQLAEKLAIKSGNVLVWYQDFELIENNDFIFGNDAFCQKLGVKRNDLGFITIKSLRKTILKTNKEERILSRNFLEGLNNIYTYTKDSMKRILVKHHNLDTNEEFYFEHTVEVEDKFEDGTLKLVGGFMRDVTESIRNQEEIKYLANNDLLTGLRNRNYFDSFVKSGKLPKDYCVMLFDLDGLKLINDAFGHLEGDRVIKLLAKMLQEIYTENIFIARIGGDEIVVLVNETDPDKITDLANILEARLEAYNKTSHIEMNVSKGGYVVVDNDVSFENAFIHAENLMYRRKLNNRSSRKSKTLDSILETLNQKTLETKEHSDRIGDLGVKVMHELGMTRASEKEDMLLLAKLHDVGKITIPDYILNKPSRLTNEEFTIIKKHSEAGYKIVKNITDSDFVSDGILSHHERYDGKGYPQGLKGDEIPLFARILSVCDAFDAMTSDRPYQQKMTEQEALKEIKENSGSQFDPTIVNAFIKIFER